MTTTQPVIVAGAGPAGSLLALYLAQHDIPVILLEKEDSLPIDLRASTFHPPSLEMLDKLGVTEKLIAKGLVVDKYQYRDRRTGEVAEFDMSIIADETAFPFRLQLEQYEMTIIVGEMLKDYPHVQVRFGCKVVDSSQTDDLVSVDIETPAGKETLTTPFLIGCDGASSNVRKSAGIGYGGFTYDEKFLVVSTDFPFEQVFDNLSYVNYVSDPEEWCVILRTEKKWRVLWPTTSDITDETYLSDDYIQARLQHLYAKDGEYDIGHRTLYNVHQRVSEIYYNGRIVLAGDSCHINNPLGGMGMNGGLHDADNLAEKLVAIINDGADHIEKFKHYDRQRRELAVKFVQEHTISNKKLMESTETEVQIARQKMLMETAADPIKSKAFVMERAMLNCVRDSLAVE
ncbi:NAD(P)/FAD-dependent oxidoreductase [Oceanicoccus sp. KOV_DT_Chl]|uniref:FAD-dependent oxidoreductase n=1 Tax=Oceanicoccus sp. KOV_DT_Chl TaxID=1904639 RepID=UPI001358C85A|nr:NAD(P)/FAD-dependent oxidoreductase [Oceanicoccus sp. KOV_DT_Chl]